MFVVQFSLTSNAVLSMEQTNHCNNLKEDASSLSINFFDDDKKTVDIKKVDRRWVHYISDES